ncbi:hypothetical protein ACQ4PT_029457 [Festuca glaucescens]
MAVSGKSPQAGPLAAPVVLNATRQHVQSSAHAPRHQQRAAARPLPLSHLAQHRRARMETAAAATSYPVARDAPPRPAPQTAQLGQAPARPGWGHWAILALAFLLLSGSFAWGVYQSRHRPRNLAFVVVTYYLIALLYCCLAKLDLLRRDDPAVAAERWRVRMAVWCVSVALANTVAARVADAMPNAGFKIAVWVFTSVCIGVGFYFFFVRADARRRTDGRALREVSPEQRV